MKRRKNHPVEHILVGWPNWGCGLPGPLDPNWPWQFSVPRNNLENVNPPMWGDWLSGRPAICINIKATQDEYQSTIVQVRFSQYVRVASHWDWDVWYKSYHKTTRSICCLHIFKFYNFHPGQGKSVQMFEPFPGRTKIAQNMLFSRVARTQKS